jgi:hypothetical protein
VAVSYAFFYDVPGSEQMYQQVKEAIGDEPPKGLIVHLVVHTDTGLRHINLWETREDWDRFRDERVEPAVHAVLTAAGFSELPPDPVVQELSLLDVWIGS